MATESNSYGFTVPYLDQGKTEPTFQVESFKGAEALSNPYLFTVSLVSATENISDVIYKRATLSIRMGGQSSQYHGVITRFEQKRKEGEFVYYEAALKPLFDILSLTRQSDVFLNLPLSDSIYADPTDTVHQAHPGSTTPPTDIITPVFKTAGFDGPYALNLRGPNLNDAATFYAPLQNADDGNYNRWSYCCQYEETCLDFLSRIFAREGVYYYFTQGADEEVLCITDNYLSHAQPAGEILYKPPAELATEPEANIIQSLVCKEEMLPKRVTLLNNNYEQAGKSVLSATAFVSSDGSTENTTYRGEVRIYGENFISSANDEGTKLAKVRAQELFCQGRTYSGFGTAVPLMPGMLIKIVHTNPAFSGAYLVRDVHHQGSQKLALVGAQGTEGEDSFYTNTFTLIPNDNTNAALGISQFRPERKTTKPRITGTMNAFIHGDVSDKYAELDQFGRYLVDLPFAVSTDSTGKQAMKKSAWMRMATHHAGSGATYGMHFPLHVGAEVILSFRDGDPDLPIIAGAAFNSQSANVVNSKEEGKRGKGVYGPQSLVIESAGGNKIVMNDTEDEESILIHCPYPGKKGSGITFGSGGESVFTLKASGDKHEVIVGQEDDLVMGSLNIGVLGSLFEAVIGTANELHIGTSVEMQAGAAMEMNLGEKFEYKKIFEKLCDESELTGTKEVKIRAGCNAMEKKSVAYLINVLTGICAGVGTILAAGAGDIAGATDPEGENMKREGGVAAGVLASALILQSIAFTLISILSKYQKSIFKPASTLEMDAAGIKMVTTPAATDGIKIGTNPDALNNPTIGMNISSSSILLQCNDQTTSMTLANDYIDINKMNTGRIYIDDTGVVVSDSSETGGIVEVGGDGVVIRREGGGPNLTMNADMARLMHNDASVTASGTQVNIVAQAINIASGAITVDNGVVKIGGVSPADYVAPPAE